MNRFQLMLKMAKNCVKTGEFTLNSGAKSNVYFDKYQVMTNADMFNSAIEQMANLLFSNDDAYLKQFIAPELGGAMLATALQQYMYTKYRSSVELNIVRSESKDHGIGDVVLGRLSQTTTAVIVDDVITSGKAILDTISKVHHQNPNIRIAQIIALVDRGGEGVKMLRDKKYNVSTVFTFDEITQADMRPDLHNW